MTVRRMAWIVGAGAVLALAALPARAVPTIANEGLCAAETAAQERLYGIPAALLHAISIVESGRYDSSHKAVIAWPWTVMAEGQGRYLPSKAEAIAEVKRLKARGVQNIDVGCMQVNLRHHPTAFANLEEAFDPAANVGYAARFLKGLFGATGHWPTAASYYHSQTPHLAAAYRERLMKVWNAPPGSTGTQVASARVKPVPSAPPLQQVPGNAKAEEIRKAWRESTLAARTETARIAEAYRQARVTEYQMRRVRFQEARNALSTTSRH
ncbi:Soluble lytic murein transglycosylase and related regulatory protein (some containing LysM/invasin domains) [Paramagnetospirillum magnetotacticum MS-1]|uniref:Soluble lytic murein transglycosylase and related regulatory protein (Some containing LysM/invasin domains) n=1 Tax=Paramagnetospirillum magnetotacticum MS-1 TaxID=272627 RepID=A0A0C2YT50_PARME|nr:transglycosylase SLT domain-containing protein [Paramagnetospirillum magnetotacticum]KIL98323.1 Soluble lytic murein transglycosylase and related regulatory protein (some containing LysM/invasin domains) [Paramagnetospirillum magnetotacticum MS-1]